MNSFFKTKTDRAESFSLRSPSLPLRRERASEPDGPCGSNCFQRVRLACSAQIVPTPAPGARSACGSGNWMTGGGQPGDASGRSSLRRGRGTASRSSRDEQGKHFDK